MAASAYDSAMAVLSGATSLPAAAVIEADCILRCRMAQLDLGLDRVSLQPEALSVLSALTAKGISTVLMGEVTCSESALDSALQHFQLRHHIKHKHLRCISTPATVQAPLPTSPRIPPSPSSPEGLRALWRSLRGVTGVDAGACVAFASSPDMLREARRAGATAVRAAGPAAEPLTLAVHPSAEGDVAEGAAVAASGAAEMETDEQAVDCHDAGGNAVPVDDNQARTKLAAQQPAPCEHLLAEGTLAAPLEEAPAAVTRLEQGVCETRALGLTVQLLQAALQAFVDKQLVDKGF